MASSDRPEPGDSFTYERSFTPAEVQQFGELSGDQQAIHTEPDADGRVMVQGLLTATLPTKIGGDLGVLARRMVFEFHRPVYTGERIACEVTLASVTDRDDGRLAVTGRVECRNETDGIVLSGEFDGLVRPS